MIEDVEGKNIVAQGKSFAELKILESAEVESVLEWAPKYISAAGRVTILEVVTNRRPTARIAWRNSVRPGSVGRRNTKGCGIQNRFVTVYTSSALQHRIGRGGTHPPNRNNRISNEVLAITPEDTGCAAAEVDHAKWLSALQHRDAIQSPSIQKLASNSME